MKPRVLFLDIDGVLNTRDYVERAHWQPPLGGAHDSAILDPLAIERLNAVVEATGAVIVITSSWRATYGRQALEAMLESRGFRGRIAASTPHLTSRSKEIARWLAANEVESFVIVDDDEEAGSEHRTRFVQTTFEAGLTDAKATAIVALFQGGQGLAASCASTDG